MRIFTFVFALTLPLLAAAPALAQTPRIGVDPRVEFMAIVFKLAGSPEYNQNRFDPYIADIEAHFGRFRDHPAIQRARAVRDTEGLRFSTVMSVAVHLTDPPELAERVPFDGRVHALTPGTLDLVEALREFAVDSRAAEFFAAHRELYDSAGARLRRLAAGEDFGWFAEFFGTPAAEEFIVVPLLANSGTSFGPAARLPGERPEVYAILGHERHDSAGFPVYEEGRVATLVHEFTHSWANDLVRERMAELERSATRVHALAADAMREQAYGRWQSMVNETLVRAAVARYTAAHADADALDRYMAEQRARGWLWLDELSARLAEYERDRATYPTLRAFMPRLVAWFDSLPDRVPAMQRAYDALRPRVVEISVPNGAEGVNPATTEIVVRFDRPVSTDGWGIRPVPDARDLFPTIAAQELGEGGTVLRMTVSLEPEHDYALQLNRASGGGFVDAAGVPLATYVVRFRTGPGT